MGQDLSQLAPPLAQAVQAMMDDPQVGNLTVSSGWRSEASQIALRQQHCGPTQYDIYQKPSGQCSPPTAIPGTSNHEFTLNGQPWALAVDLAGDLSDAHDVMAKYGLHTPVTGEPWHFELVNTAAVKKLALSGATVTPTGALMVPGLGPVGVTGPSPQTATQLPTDWPVRIASFAAGIGLLGIGLFITLRHAGSSVPGRSGALDSAGREHTTQPRKQDLTDDGGNGDDQTDPDTVDDTADTSAPASDLDPGGGAELVAAT